MLYKFISLLFAIFFTFWTVRVYYKLYDGKTRRYFLIIGLLMIFWMLIRIIKGVALEAKVERVCWYLYYLPLIFIPALFNICTSSLKDKMNNKREIFIYLLSTILFLLVLTNDYHELVFKFNIDLEHHDNYKHYVGYYLIFAWILYLLGDSMISLAINRFKLKKDLKMLFH